VLRGKPLPKTPGTCEYGSESERGRK
jgi:hypothetical protein